MIKEFLKFPATILSLFLSTSTLICCAIPSFFILIGAGATLANFVNSLPFLIIFSQNKLYVTLMAFFFLLVAFIINYNTRESTCPSELKLKSNCTRSKTISQKILFISFLIFIFSSAYTYLITYLL